MKMTIRALLRRYESDPELVEVLGQIDTAIKDGNLGELLVVLVHKDDTFTVAHTFEDTYRALGALSMAQNELMTGEGEL